MIIFILTYQTKDKIVKDFLHKVAIALSFLKNQLLTIHGGLLNYDSSKITEYDYRDEIESGVK